MISRSEVITDGNTYYLEGNIGPGEECEYVSPNSENELRVYGNERPEDTGVLTAKLKPGTEDMWAFQGENTNKYLKKSDANENAEVSSETPVYFQLIGDDVNQIMYETPGGDHLYLSMFDTEEGSNITFAAESSSQASKQKWKFVRTKGGVDFPNAYGG